MNNNLEKDNKEMVIKMSDKIAEFPIELQKWSEKYQNVKTRNEFKIVYSSEDPPSWSKNIVIEREVIQSEYYYHLIHHNV